jgi:WD40 repeat protein
VLAGAQDGTVSGLDVRRQTPLWQSRAHDKQVSSVSMGPDGHLGASGGLDTLVHVWNVATGERLRTLPTGNGSVRNLAFARNGKKIASAGQWRTQVWDLDRPSEPPQSFGGAEGQTDIDLRPDLRFLATCHGGSGLVRLWDLAPDPRVDHWPAHGAAVTGLAVGGDAGTIVSGGADGALSMWHVGQPVSDFSLKPGGRPGGLALSDDKRWIVSSGYPGGAAVWRSDDGQRVADLSDIRSARAALFADRDRRLIVGEADGHVSIWDWSNGVARNHRRVRSHDSEVLAMASHGARLFVTHRETVVFVRDAATGREIRSLNPSASPFSIAVSPDGRLLAAGTWPGIVDLWDVDTGSKLPPLKGPTALVTGLDFSPDGSLLALSSRDGSTRLWDVAAREWLATVATRRPGAERVRFLPDGQRLAIGYEDGEVEIRDLQYFFRYAAGHAAHQLEVFRRSGESFPRSGEVLAWSRSVLSPLAVRP